MEARNERRAYGVIEPFVEPAPLDADDDEDGRPWLVETGDEWTGDDDDNEA